MYAPEKTKTCGDFGVVAMGNPPQAAMNVLAQFGCRAQVSCWANYNDVSRRLVTLNGGLIRELPQNPRNIQV